MAAQKDGMLVAICKACHIVVVIINVMRHGLAGTIYPMYTHFKHGPRLPTCPKVMGGSYFNAYSATPYHIDHTVTLYTAAQSTISG